MLYVAVTIPFDQPLRQRLPLRRWRLTVGVRSPVFIGCDGLRVVADKERTQAMHSSSGGYMSFGTTNRE